MALNTVAVQDLLNRLDADRKGYLATLNQTHELLAHLLTRPQFTGAPSATDSVSPLSLPTSPILGFSQSIRRARASSAHDLEGPHRLWAGDDSSESDDDESRNESLCVREALPPEEFSETQLRRHLETYNWNEHGRILLGDLISKDKPLASSEFFSEEELDEKLDSNHSFADIYEVAANGYAILASRADGREGLRTTWEELNTFNSEAKGRSAVGRITILREPISLLFGAIHLTMAAHFDMDMIFKLLIDETTTRAYMRGCLQDEPIRQRSFVFCFKYHTIVGEDRESMHFQESDKDLSSTDDHIPISTCSSIVALSFSGNPSITRPRKSRKRSVVGKIYDPFSPWRVLSIQCYPDWKHSVDVHEPKDVNGPKRHYVNGPDAFLVTLLAEYRDASKRFMALNKRIVKLVTPPRTFLFDRQLRDKLLFESGEYTYSRRYFWAFQALAMLSDEVQSLISQYKETFTEEVWTGRDTYIWPGTKDQSPRFRNWRKKMASLRKQFDGEIITLEQILESNEREQKEIKSLNNQLFSGTSVQESRQAVKQAQITVMQGYNIRLLTLVSIFFLPLMFVTSVFGMTNMNPNDSYRPVGIATVLVCLPTYFLIGSVNSPERIQAIAARLGSFFAFLYSGFCSNPASDQQNKENPSTKNKTSAFDQFVHPSRSLSAYERAASRPAHVAHRPQLSAKQGVVEQSIDSELTKVMHSKIKSDGSSSDIQSIQEESAHSEKQGAIATLEDELPQNPKDCGILRRILNMLKRPKPLESPV